MGPWFPGSQIKGVKRRQVLHLKPVLSRSSELYKTTHIIYFNLYLVAFKNKPLLHQVRLSLTMKFLVVIFALVFAASAGTTFSRGFKIGGIHRLGVDDLFFITRLKLVINLLTFQSAGWPVFGPWA